jgi:hypothetical protein
MFEAYKIGVRIAVADGTRGNILKIAAQFAKAQAEASSFLKVLREVNEELSRKTSWASSAAQDFRNARREAEGYARAARSARGATSGAGGGASPASISASNMVMAAALGRMQQEDQIRFRGYPNQALPGSASARLGAPPVRLLGAPSGALLSMAGGRGGGSIVPPSPSTAGGFPYRGGGAVRAAGWPFGFGGGRGNGGGGSNGGGFNYNAFGRMMGGAMLARGGEVELGMLQAPIDEAARYQSAVARFQLFGLGDRLNADAIKFARSMKIVGTSMTDAVNYMAEAQGVFRESGLQGSEALRGAKLAAPMLAKIAFATSGLDEESQSRLHTQSLAMLRFIEMRGGLNSPAAFNGIAEAGWKAIRSSGGNVNWEQLRQFMARGGVAAQGLSNKALFGELEPVIGELKGSTAGNAWMTSYNRLVGGVRLPNQVAHLLADNGIWDASRIVWNSQGGIKRFNGNPLRDMQTFSSDPVAFYEKNILPMYQRMHLDSTEDRARENTLIFGRTGGMLFSLIDRQMENIKHSVEAQNKTLGIDASVNVAKGTYQGQLLNYHKQMQNLQIALGTQILPMLIRGLQWLNPHLAQAAAWIGRHSTLTKGLLVLFAGIGTLAMVSGAVVSVGGAFTLISGAITAGGGLAAGLAGVSTGLTALAPAMAAVVAAMLAWKAGSAAGKYISDHYVSGTKFGDWLGSAEAHTLAFFGNKDAKEAIANNAKWKAHLASNYTGNAGHAIQVHSKVYLDKREVGRAVTQHQTREAMRPQTGMSSFDGSMMPGPIGFVGGNG